MDYTISDYWGQSSALSGILGAAQSSCGRRENGLMTEPWTIDELAHAGPEHLDPAFVTGYDRKRGYPDPAGDLAIFEARGLARTRAFSTSAPGPASSRSPPRGGLVT